MRWPTAAGRDAAKQFRPRVRLLRGSDHFRTCYALGGAELIITRRSGSRSAAAGLDAQVPIFLIQGMLRLQSASLCRPKTDSHSAQQRPGLRYLSKAPTGHHFRCDRSLAAVPASPTSVDFGRSLFTNCSADETFRKQAYPRGNIEPGRRLGRTCRRHRWWHYRRRCRQRGGVLGGSTSPLPFIAWWKNTSHPTAMKGTSGWEQFCRKQASPIMTSRQSTASAIIAIW